MRFAEHMMLEATHYKLAPYCRNDNQEHRCALGLVEGEDYGNYAEHIYPWIMETITVIPCSCSMAYCNSGNVPHGVRVPVTMGIVHLFNEHVMQGGKQKEYGICSDPCEPWTMEQLADWINSVDPTPDQPDDQKEKQQPEEEEEPDTLPAAITL